MTYHRKYNPNKQISEFNCTNLKLYRNKNQHNKIFINV